MVRSPSLGSSIDDCAGALREAHLATIVELLEADAGGLPRLRVGQHDVREVQRRLALDDPARLGLRRPGVALDHVHAADQDAVLLRQDAQHLAGLALVAACGHHHTVALPDARGHYKTSGASEMIFMNFLASSSSVTGPKMREIG